jgi:zinc transport system substrate-binding protein
VRARSAALARAGIGLVSLASFVSACGGSGTSAPRAPILTVATGLYPLAQAVSEIGGSDVRVTDVVPPGSDPRTYRLSAAQVALVKSSSLVVDVGGGFQPHFEEAAAGAKSVAAVAGEGSDQFPWLDPNQMLKTVATIASAMERADPEAVPVFRAGARDVSDSVASTGIDYQSTLSTCPRTTIFTPDRAFAAMARDYGLTDRVVTAEPRSVAEAASALASTSTTTVFQEPWTANDGIDELVTISHPKVRTLDTLTGPPRRGWPHGATYLGLMEANLGALSRALGCPDQSTGT